jgi:hypothetical protein
LQDVLPTWNKGGPDANAPQEKVNGESTQEQHRNIRNNMIRNLWFLPDQAVNRRFASKRMAFLNGGQQESSAIYPDDQYSKIEK